MSKLVGTVAIVTIASCGAEDDIWFICSVFCNISVTNLLLTLFVFLILIFFFVISTPQKLANIPGIENITRFFINSVSAIIYIALGLFIIIENDTIQTIFRIYILI
ncbi:cadmium resistance transporter [Staphylococcus aureus]